MSLLFAAGCGTRRRRLRIGCPGRRRDRRHDAAQAALRDHSEGARHPGLQLREDRRRARGRRNSATSKCCGTRRQSADQLKQKEILESYITQRVDGIAISSLNGDFLTDTINRAIDAGIPVITWDSDAPKSKRIAFYGVDDLASGRIMGEQAIKLLNGKGKVALITSLGATNLQNRLNGVQGSAGEGAGHPDRRDLRHQGRHAPLRGDHRHRIAPLSRPRRVDFGRRLAGVHAECARRRRSVEDQGDLVRHDQPRARSAARRQGAGAARPEVFRLGQRVGASCSATSSKARIRRRRSSIRASTSSRKTTSTPTNSNGRKMAGQQP